MKTLTIITLAIIATASLSACQVSARDKDTSVSVNTSDSRYYDNRDDGYRHCPPGHAKKGWC